MAYDTPASLRQALEARLAREARDRGIDLARLRRRVLFERILIRLEAANPGLWVLKGGMALEVRLGNRARSTRDLDLALRERQVEAGQLRERLIAAFAADPEGDGFTFEVGVPEKLRLDEVVGGGLRFPVRGNLAGREFASIRLDVAARPEEVRYTERLHLPGMLAFAGRPPRAFETVSPNQTFAEKLHALTRDYGDRENTRMRDLADLVLLIEQRLLTEAALLEVTQRLFEVRGTHPVPQAVPDPPSAWRGPYKQLAEQLELEARSLDAAVRVVRAVWSRVLQASRVK